MKRPVIKLVVLSFWLKGGQTDRNIFGGIARPVSDVTPVEQGMSCMATLKTFPDFFHANVSCFVSNEKKCCQVKIYLINNLFSFLLALLH